MKRCDLCGKQCEAQEDCLCRQCKSDPFRVVLNGVYSIVGVSDYTMREFGGYQKKIADFGTKNAELTAENRRLRELTDRLLPIARGTVGAYERGKSDIKHLVCNRGHQQIVGLLQSKIITCTHCIAFQLAVQAQEDGHLRPLREQLAALSPDVPESEDG